MIAEHGLHQAGVLLHSLPLHQLTPQLGRVNLTQHHFGPPLVRGIQGLHLFHGEKLMGFPQLPAAGYQGQGRPDEEEFP